MSWPFPRSRSLCRDLVVTPKSPSAIPVATSLSRDVVIQAALDPTVTEIEYVRAVPVGIASYLFNGIVLVRDASRHAVEFREDAATLRTLDDEGLRLLAIEKLQASRLDWARNGVLKQPRCSNARLVWECARHRVRLDRRIAILDALDTWGALPLRNFDAPREDVFALACEAAVDIDLDASDLDGAHIRRSSRPSAPRNRTIGV